MNYDTNLKYKWDNENVLAYAVQQAVESRAVQTAKKMKEKNYPLSDIIEITGLIKEEIEKL